MLSNLETEKSKLIQIVLVGQPNLRDVLGRPELEQLRQRITVRYHLRPLDADRDGGLHQPPAARRRPSGRRSCSRREVDRSDRPHSEGVPRKINVIADAVLLFGYGEDKRTIDAPLVRDVLEELDATGVIVPPASMMAPAGMPAPALVPATAPGPAVASPAPSSPLRRRRSAPHHPRQLRRLRRSPPHARSRHAVAAAAAAFERELAAREAKITARERELAEQQRILTERYRLLKARESQAAVAAAASAAVWPPKRPAAAPVPAAATVTAAPPTAPPARQVAPVPTTSHAPAHGMRDARDPLHAPGLWARVRRAMFGVGRPLFED